MLLDLRGRTFGRLRVIRLSKRSGKRTYWRCRCSCGVMKDIRSDGLRSGAVVSCGCYHRQRISERGFTHPPGTRFARLVVIKVAGRKTKRGRIYECSCDCGKLVRVQGRHLRSGESKSCGCWYDETRPLCTLRHGHSRIRRRSPEYSAYQHAKSVCNNQNDHGYYCVGGRGIGFLFASFEAFLAEVGLRPSPDHRLLRSDRDRDFKPGNLAWVPIKKRRRRLTPVRTTRRS